MTTDRRENAVGKRKRILRKCELTSAHITNGVRENSGYCVVAEAVKDALPEARKVMVAPAPSRVPFARFSITSIPLFSGSDIQTVRYTIGDERFIHLTPARAQAAIINFDMGVEPEPGTIWFDRPIQRIQRHASQRRTTTVTRSGGSAGTSVKGVTVNGGRVIPSGGTRRQFGSRGLRLSRVLPGPVKVLDDDTVDPLPSP